MQPKTITEWVHSYGWVLLVNGIPASGQARVADLTTWSVVLSPEQIHALAQGVSPMMLAAKDPGLIIHSAALDRIDGVGEPS